jgi:hypothetical protein
MHLTRLAAAVAVTASALAGGLLSAAPAQAATFTKSVQLESDNTNLDAYYGNVVWTRDPSLTYQNWQFTQVGSTPEGTGIYDIASAQFGTCITDVGVGNAVTQTPCNPNNLAQRFVVNTAQEHTTIASLKNRDEVLQGNGIETAVTLSPYAGTGAANQWWTLYDK